MLLQWLLITTLYSFFVDATECNTMLGTAVRATDCQIALNLLITKLKLYPPQNSFESVHHTFTLRYHGDPRYEMPQGAQFESCGIAVDMSHSTTALARWNDLFGQFGSLIAGCPGGRATHPPSIGLGGTSTLGSFIFMVVDPGQGLRNIAGTCMTPRPPHAMGVVWHVAERLCGFQNVAQLYKAPDTSQLPPVPALFPIGVTFDRAGWSGYRVRGQWLWNADVWSPTVGNPFSHRMNVRRMWILMTAGTYHGIPIDPAPFSRTIPRAMSSAWIRQQHGPPIQFLGAWGSRTSTWFTLSGDLSNIQAYLQANDWILIELGAGANEPTTTTTISPEQTLATATEGSMLLQQGQTPVANSNDRDMLSGSAGSNRMINLGLLVDRPGHAHAAEEETRPNTTLNEVVEASGSSIPSIVNMTPFPTTTLAIEEGGMANPSIFSPELGWYVPSPRIHATHMVGAQLRPPMPPQRTNMPQLNVATNDTTLNDDAQPPKRQRAGP